MGNFATRLVITDEVYGSVLRGILGPTAAAVNALDDKGYDIVAVALVTNGGMTVGFLITAKLRRTKEPQTKPTPGVLR